jgi:phthiocerol/phenolphthiocerol synthesis type-I polyketide synthase E
MSAKEMTNGEALRVEGDKQRQSIVADAPVRKCAAPTCRSPEEIAIDFGLPVVFMFPGGGAQHPGMGSELYDSEPVFRSQIDACAFVAQKYLHQDLREAMYAEDKSCLLLQRPAIALSALFVTEYALAKLWMFRGIQPRAMIGHSLGEYVAACLAGVFTVQDAIALVALRGLLFEKIEEGAMLSVPLPPQEFEGLLNCRLSIAAINAPNLCVVSGSREDIDSFEEKLNRMAVESQRIPIPVPAHSVLLHPVLNEFSAAVARIELRRPQIKFISNVTGTWMSAEEATNPGYWTRHLRQTVQFARGMENLLRAGYNVMLEVGPSRVLSSLGRLQLHDGEQFIFPSMRRRNDSTGDASVFRSSLAQLRVISSEYRLQKSAAQLHRPC